MALDVGTVCLGILSLGDATGYEIKKMFEDDKMQIFVEASFGSIYPALARLAKDGLVEVRTESGNGRPDRKIYSLTAAGKKAFDEVMLGQPGPDRFRSDFLFMLLFADLIPGAHLSALIDEKIADLEGRIDYITQRMPDAKTPGQRFVASHGRAICEAAIRHLRDNRHLLEETLPADAPAPARKRA